MIRVRRIFLCAIAVVLVIGRQAAAQTLRGTAHDSVTRFPIAGVVVSLLDSSGKTLARVLTNERGEFGVRRSDLARRVRAQRLGFRMREIELPPTSNDDAVLDVAC